MGLWCSISADHAAPHRDEPAPQQAALDGQRVWPEPVTMYFVEVSSARPIGPRACSFCVEIPISAPYPNSPPSTNRLDAFTSTTAASMAPVNSRAAANDLVTIVSEWPVPYRRMCSIASSIDGTTRADRSSDRYS